MEKWKIRAWVLESLKESTSNEGLERSKEIKFCSAWELEEGGQSLKQWDGTIHEIWKIGFTLRN